MLVLNFQLTEASVNPAISHFSAMLGSGINFYDAQYAMVASLLPMSLQISGSFSRSVILGADVIMPLTVTVIISCHNYFSLKLNGNVVCTPNTLRLRRSDSSPGLKMLFSP